MTLSRRTFLGAGAATAALLAAPALRAAGPVTVTLTQGSPSHQPLLDALAAGFAAANPSMAIRFVADGETWDPLLNNTIRASIVDALPDGTWQSITYGGILAQRGIAKPLNALYGDDRAALGAIGLSDAMIDATTLGGETYCIPFGTTIPIVYCNMDLLRKAGWTRDRLPASWDEICDIGARVVAMQPGVNGAYIEYTATNAWTFQNLLTSFGGRMMNDARTEITFDGPEGLRGMEILRRIGEVCPTDMTQEQSRQAFRAGATAMHIQSASGTTATSKAVAGMFDLAVAQFPVLPDTGRLVGAGNGFFLFTDDAEKRRVVWEFMKFAAGVQGQTIMAQTSGYMPTSMVALRDPAFLEAYLQANPFHRPIVERLVITGDQFSFPSDNTVEIIKMMGDEMNRIVTLRAMPEESLRRMGEQARRLLA